MIPLAFLQWNAFGEIWGMLGTKLGLTLQEENKLIFRKGGTIV
jgi:hypothetical protein